MRQLIIVFFSLTIFTSCDPGYAVYLLNNSSQDKNVKVVERESQRVASIDSVLIADTLSTNFETVTVKKKAISSKDVLQKSYSFILGAGKTARLRQGIGKPKLSDLLLKVILDSNDTIVLTSDKRIRVDRKPMSTKVSITVK